MHTCIERQSSWLPQPCTAKYLILNVIAKNPCNTEHLQCALTFHCSLPPTPFPPSMDSRSPQVECLWDASVLPLTKRTCLSTLRSTALCVMCTSLSHPMCVCAESMCVCVWAGECVGVGWRGVGCVGNHAWRDQLPVHSCLCVCMCVCVLVCVSTVQNACLWHALHPSGQPFK